MDKIMYKVLVIALFVLSVSVFAGKPVNINKADAKLLAESLDGIGEAKAKKIVDYRERLKVSFKSLEDLRQVKGIGPKTLEINAKYIKF